MNIVFFSTREARKIHWNKRRDLLYTSIYLFIVLSSFLLEYANDATFAIRC